MVFIVPSGTITLTFPTPLISWVDSSIVLSKFPFGQTFICEQCDSNGPNAF